MESRVSKGDHGGHGHEKDSQRPTALHRIGWQESPEYARGGYGGLLRRPTLLEAQGGGECACKAFRVRQQSCALVPA